MRLPLAAAATGEAGLSGKLPPDLAVLIVRVQRELRAEDIAELAQRLRDAPVEIVASATGLQYDGAYCPSDWPRLPPKQVALFAEQPDGWAALGILSSHPNGYVREAAVRALSWRTEGLEIPFLVLRLNDWVSQVRQAALAGLNARLRIDFVDAWVRSLPLVIALRAQRRADHGGFVDAVFALLARREALGAIWRGLAAADRRTRRACFDLALASGEEELLAMALADRDLVVRIAVADRLRTLPSGAQRQPWIDRLIEDRSSVVRGRSLPLLAEEPEAWRAPRLERLGSDESGSIRATARKLLPIEWAALYRGLLARNERVRAAIFGLGECGSDEDLFLIEPRLVDPRPKVRGAALVATAMLDEESVAPFVELLADPSKRVSRAAAQRLEKRSRMGLGELLRAIAERDPLPPHTRAHVLAVVSSFRFWPRLIWFLEAIRSPCRELAELSAASIRVLTSEHPLREQLAAVEKLLDGAPLPESEIAYMRRELEEWRPKPS